MTNNYFLSIDKCPAHGFYAISLDDDSGGHRLTPSKCCGRWERVKAWKMDAKQLRDIAIEIECSAERLEEVS